MTHSANDRAIPGADERAALNAALVADGTETGWWDEHGRPAPWPDDIDQYKPAVGEPTSLGPGEEPF